VAGIHLINIIKIDSRLQMSGMNKKNL